MVHFVALLQAAKNRNRIFLVRLIYQHALEPTLKRGVLFNVLPILIKRRRAHAVQFAPSQGRLEHISRIHRAFRLTRPHHGVELIDEQNHTSVFLTKLIEHRFQALLKITAEFGTGEKRPEIQGQDPLTFEPFGHLTIYYPLRQPLDNRCLSNARLTD